MTRDTRFEESITTTDALSSTLRDLLLAAHANGVDVTGGWECRSEGDTPDWEAVVTELVKETDRAGAAGE